MTKETFSKAVNNIDDEFIENAANFKSKKIISLFKCCAAAAALIVIIVSAIFFGKPVISKFPTDSDPVKGGDYQNTAQKKVTVTGTGYTDEQIKEYINNNKSMIAFTVAAEYGCTDEIKVMTKGYCHASLGEKNTVKRDFLTLPILQNDKIVASIVIFTADEELTNTINIGGEIWDNLNKAFNENPDSELIMAYAGGVCEVAITPDNRIYEINQGGKAFFDDGVDWYSLLKSDHNTFSSKQLKDSNNFIVISDVKVPGTVQNNENTNTTQSPNIGGSTGATSTTANTIQNADDLFTDSDITRITVIAEFREQMGASPVTVPDRMLSSFIKNISGLKLTSTNEPEGFTGGGYVVTVYDKNGRSERYIFMNETIVQLHGKYYNETSGAGKILIDDIISLLK